MVLAANDIALWLSSFMLPLFRIAALVTASPVLGTRMVPARIKLFFAIGLTIIVGPLVPELPTVDLFSLNGMLVAIQQVIIGLAMGFALQLVFAVFVYSGQVVALTMGLGFASLNDPATGVVVPTVSQFYSIMVTLVFFALGGHLVMIEVLVDSFKTLPVGLEGVSRTSLWSLLSWVSYMFSGAVLVVLPAIAAMLIVNVGFGVLMRASPQLNIFAVGFPVIMTLGFVVIYISLPSLIPQFERLLASGFELMREIGGGK
jgi:flagellar biosynthetic protein FliR